MSTSKTGEKQRIVILRCENGWSFKSIQDYVKRWAHPIEVIEEIPCDTLQKLAAAEAEIEALKSQLAFESPCDPCDDDECSYELSQAESETPFWTM